MYMYYQLCRREKSVSWCAGASKPAFGAACVHCVREIGKAPLNNVDRRWDGLARLGGGGGFALTRLLEVNHEQRNTVGIFEHWCTTVSAVAIDTHQCTNA